MTTTPERDTLDLTPKEREQLLEFCRLAAGWYVNNQNTAKRSWGGVGNSADAGRFLYEYRPLTGECRGNGVWGQAVAIMALLPLAARLGRAGEPYREAAMAAAKYLLSLQIMDSRDERVFGALREATPQTSWVYPRDGATGAMAFCALYRETNDEEYLHRARLYADWYLRMVMDKEDGWPCWTYDFDTHEATHGYQRSATRQDGIWQAGSGLLFYYLYRLTGEQKYIEAGLRPLMQGVKRLYADAEQEYATRTDDFATLAALGALLVYDDADLLALVRHRVSALVAQQDADGSCPGLAGEYIAGLTWHNFCQFVEHRKLKDALGQYRQALVRAAAFAPTLQERDKGDLRAYGGMYGQTSFGVSRELIHHRTTGYALIFMLRTEARVEVSGYNVFGW